MENNKLKKLGKYFTKGLLTGLLATALMAGTAGCSQPAGGNTTDNGGGITGGGTPTADICGLVHEYLQHPAYMNVTGDFGGQRFVESNADWFYDGQNDKDTKFTTRYNDADQYIDCKVTELNKLWQENNTGSLSSQINYALDNFNNGASISKQIDNNFAALAPIYKAMAYTLADGNKNTDFHKFNVSYQKLAADAFNQSIGGYAINDSNKRLFTTNSEMTEGSYFANNAENNAGLSYTEATNSTQAETRMRNYLSTIAAKTKTDVTVLKKIIELALYSESLYGLNDFAGRCEVKGQGLTDTERSLTLFQTKITNATYSISNSQDIDDRTM